MYALEIIRASMSERMLLVPRFAVARMQAARCVAMLVLVHEPLYVHSSRILALARRFAVMRTSELVPVAISVQT